MVFSGDTRPCRALVRAGAGATLLIHEATFEPQLAAMAARKRHSTSAEALGVADAMRAYRVALTHFSQRYPKAPAGVDAAARPWRNRPLVAADGACLRFADLPALPALAPALALALAEQEEGALDGT